MSEIVLIRIFAATIGLFMVDAFYCRAFLPLAKHWFVLSLEDFFPLLNAAEAAELKVQPFAINYIRGLIKVLQGNPENISISSYLHFRVENPKFESNDNFDLFRREASKEVMDIYNQVGKKLSIWMALNSPGWTLFGVAIYLLSKIFNYALEKWFRREAVAYVDQTLRPCHS